MIGVLAATLFLLAIGMTSGCSIPQQIVKVPEAVVLQKDKIYTLPAGQMVSLERDGEPIDMTFPEPMKIVSSDFLVGQEVMKNEDLYKAIKAEKSKGTRNTILGSILSIVATIGGVWLKAWFNRKKKTTLTAKVVTE